MQGAEILTKFTADDSQVKQATKSVSKDFDLLAAAGVAAFSKIGYEFNEMIINFVKGGIEYNAEIETYMTRLETLTGSAEKANEVLDQIKRDALNTPFDVSSLTQAESLLLATGVSAEQARKDILALGDAVSASGGGNAELQRMAVNLQQIKNVGKASALDIKQFAYAGIDIYGLLADSMGITREEASKLDVSYDMLSKALNKASGEGGKYYKAMEKQSKTMVGATSNLKESWSVLKGELAQGVFEAVKDLIPKLTELFDWVAKNKDLVIAIVVPILTFTNVLLGLMIIKGIAAGFIALWTAISMNPLSIVIALIAGLVAAFIRLWKTCEPFREFFINMWDSIKTSFQSAWLILSDGFDVLVSKLMWVVEKVIWVKDTITNAWDKLKEGTSNVFNGIKETITNVFSTIGDIIKAPINAIIDAINKVIDSINSLTVPDWVPGIGGKHTDFKHINRLATGTNYVPEDMLAVIHEGEAVVPKKFNPYANGINTNSIASMGTMNPIINITINNDMEMDTLGQIVNKVKTFSGGAKNDFNYGMGGR